MTKKPTSKGTAAEEREARLKAALKANMGRRKAQARARADKDRNPQEQDKGQS